jgi:hypothetical protein
MDAVPIDLLPRRWMDIVYYERFDVGKSDFKTSPSGGS